VKRVETSLISSTVLRLELLKCVAPSCIFYALSALPLHLPPGLVFLSQSSLCRFAGDSDQHCSLLLNFFALTKPNRIEEPNCCSTFSARLHYKSATRKAHAHLRPKTHPIGFPFSDRRTYSGYESPGDSAESTTTEMDTKSVESITLVLADIKPLHWFKILQNKRIQVALTWTAISVMFMRVMLGRSPC
jgi:hypothetical protein